MKVFDFIKKLFGCGKSSSIESTKPIENVKKFLGKITVEFLDEETICKYDFFAGTCRYVKTNAPEGMIPFPGQALKSFALFNRPDVDTPDSISSVTIYVGDETTYNIPNWTWDGMLEFDYDNYKYADMLYTVSNERVIEADFSVINNIKNKAFELYNDMIGDEYDNDDIYTSCGKVIRKYAVNVYDNISDTILSSRTFDGRDDAEYYYNSIIAQCK